MALDPETQPQPGPWSADLAEYFDNEEALAAADRYMRERQQPRMTELEEGHNEWNRLLNDVRADPKAAVRSFVDELFGEDVASKFDGLFEEATTPAEVETAAETVEATGAQLTPEQQEALDWARAERQRRADEEARQQSETEYKSALDSMRAAHPDLTDDDMDAIHPFIGSAGGDTEVAYGMYQAFLGKLRQRLGVADPEPAPAPVAPPVLGSEAAPAAVPPTKTEYKTWADMDRALTDWQNEQRAGDPPPVL